MSQIIKPVMLDETGQAANQKLTELGTKIDEHKASTTTGLNTIGSKIDAHKTSTTQGLSNVGSKVEDSGQATSQSLDGVAEALQTIAEAIEAVHSVNGMTGDVIIDATNIPVSKLNNPQTVKQVLDEEQSSVDDAVNEMRQAIARTPLTFGASEIEGEDYLLTFSLGTP